MVITAYHDRVRRGRILWVCGRVHQNGEPGTFDVASRACAAVYRVQVELNDTEVASIECSCPDCQKMQEAIDEIIDSGGTEFHPGISHLHGDALCKHGIACLIEMGVMKLEDIL